MFTEFKIYIEPDGEIRRFKVWHYTPNYSGLKEHIRQLVGRDNFCLFYKDFEGDLVVCGSDGELRHACDSVSRGTTPQLRLYLRPIKKPSDSDPPKPVHRDVTCAGCLGKVAGIRFKCLECDNYDLCENCISQDQHADHDMLAVRIPGTDEWKKLFAQGYGSRKGDPGRPTTNELDQRSDRQIPNQQPDAKPPRNQQSTADSPLQTQPSVSLAQNKPGSVKRQPYIIPQKLFFDRLRFILEVALAASGDSFENIDETIENLLEPFFDCVSEKAILGKMVSSVFDTVAAGKCGHNAASVFLVTLTTRFTKKIEGYTFRDSLTKHLLHSLQESENALRSLMKPEHHDPDVMPRARRAILFATVLCQKLMGLPQFQSNVPAMMYFITITINLCFNTRSAMRSEYVDNCACAVRMVKIIGATFDRTIRINPSVAEGRTYVVMNVLLYVLSYFKQGDRKILCL